jgi:hypothetical protein
MSKASIDGLERGLYSCPRCRERGVKFDLCFDCFRLAREGRRGERPPEAAGGTLMPALRKGSRLTAEQMAHRRAMLDQFERLQLERLGPESRH